MKRTYAVKVGELRTIASDTFDGWKETFDFLKSVGVKIDHKPISDYTGQTIPSDQLFYYANNPGECPVSCPHWMF